MTPLAEKIGHDLDTRYTLLDRDKLTAYMMARAANKDTKIEDCRGGTISVGIGLEFSGTLRDVFWQFIGPCIEDTVQEACDTLDQELERYTSIPRRTETLDAVQGQLKQFANRVYDRMVELDRRMRGGGGPKSVSLYDPSAEKNHAHQFVDRKIAALRKLHIEEASSWKARFNRNWRWIVAVLGLAVALVGLFVSIV